jgi:3-hydroxyacyl-CoA dehydrogenase
VRQIKRTAVLGAGVMGATIAAHLANAGLDVLLLDIVPKELTEQEKAKGLTLESSAVRNRFATSGVQGAVKSRGLYHKNYAGQIAVGNFEDDIAKLKDCDWVIEVVVENMAIKKSLLTEKVVPNLAEGAILSSNTSGLSVNAMAELLPERHRKNFLVTHFFNPPRFLRLLEIVPSQYTDPAVIAYMAEFSSKRLGKGIVYGKDTPNFVANRIGVYNLFNAMKHLVDLGLTVEEADAASGSSSARAKSAIFRTCDLVGNDTMAHVCKNTYELLPNDEARELFQVPGFLSEMLDKGLLGQKAKQGFFKKEKTGIHFYDYQTGEYQAPQAPKFASVKAAKKAGDAAAKVKAAVNGDDKAAEYVWRNLRDTLIYSFNRIPEISDDVINIDNGMKWGFSWEIGPFEMFDAIGVADFVKRAEADGVVVPAALKTIESFYRIEAGKKFALNLTTGSYEEIPLPAHQIDLNALRESGSVLASNKDASIHDIGDGVVCLEFHSKMNAIDSGTIEMVEKAVDLAEDRGVGLVVGNQGVAFSAGANLALFLEAIKASELDKIDALIIKLQNALMRMKYCSVPVVAAPFGMVLGGGAEVALHADVINAHAETYMGLVEIGVGLLPAGGGTKEMAIRAIEKAAAYRSDVTPFISKHFQSILMGKVSGSAAELEGMSYMRPGDTVSMDIDRLIADAKQKVLALSATYRPSRPSETLKAPGRDVGAVLKSQLYNMHIGGFISEYEVELGGTIAEVITGGDVPAGTPISEQYLLDLERVNFLKLCGNDKTVERIENMLKTGKVLRN